MRAIKKNITYLFMLLLLKKKYVVEHSEIKNHLMETLSIAFNLGDNDASSIKTIKAL